MRIRPSLISRIRLITVSFISGPIPASASNPQQDLVETTSRVNALLPLKAISSRLLLWVALSGNKQKSVCDWPSTRSYLSIAERQQTRRRTLYRPLHVLHCRTSLLTLGWNRQKPLQPPASRVRTALQLCWKSLAALQSLLSLASALTRLVNGSGLLHGALRDRGLPHLPLLAVLESIHLPLGDGVSNGLTPASINSVTKSLNLTLFLVVSNKGDPDYPPNPCK